MTVTQTRQPVLDWVRGILQAKASPTEKAAQLATKEAALVAERQTLVATEPLAVIERELGALRQAQEELAPQVEAQEHEAYNAAMQKWQEGYMAIMAAIGEPLGEIEALLDKAAAHDLTHPIPPAGKRYWHNKSAQICNLRAALVALGEATELFAKGGTGSNPRLIPPRHLR